MAWRRRRERRQRGLRHHRRFDRRRRALTGRGTDWTTDMPAAGIGFEPERCLISSNASVVAGGDVRIDGTGGNLDAMRQSADFAEHRPTPRAAPRRVHRRQRHGGRGRRIDINGKAGGEGFTANARHRRQHRHHARRQFGLGRAGATDAGQPNALRADGGTVAIDAQGTDVSLRVNSFSAHSGARCRAVRQPGRSRPHRCPDLGREQHRQGRQHLGARAQCAWSTASISEFGDVPLVARLDASGATGGGSIDIAATGVIAVGATTPAWKPTPRAAATAAA
jgi:hypothetical protein